LTEEKYLSKDIKDLTKDEEIYKKEILMNEGLSFTTEGTLVNRAVRTREEENEEEIPF
jgi:hypothetical protein